MRIVIASLVLAAASAALAGPIEAKFSGANPIALYGLSDEGTCIPDRISGRVVKRVFDDGGFKMKGAVIEQQSGERTYLNIDTDKISKASAAEMGNANRGLQILLNEGNRVTLGIFACGAAGRVMMIDSVQRAR